MSATNFYEGDTCGRDGCAGVIATHPPKNCSCHISPPCSSCTDPRNFCPECDWEEADDVEVQTINNYVCKIEKDSGAYRSYSPRPLDPTKIDWRWASHTHFSMIKEGVYPFGTTREALVAAIDGTFGGRFEYHSPATEQKHGSFKYIAYTD